MELLFGDTARVIRQKCLLFVCPCDYICCCCLNERKICGDLTNNGLVCVSTCTDLWPLWGLSVAMSHVVHEPVAQPNGVFSYRKVSDVTHSLRNK